MAATRSRPFLLWATAVLACGAWYTACACSLRARSAAATECFGESGVCLRWEAVQALSPRWLSDAIGISGPLVTWALLAPTLAAASRTALLLDTVLWYLAFIMAVRYLHLALPPAWPPWDPSGHVFVYGAQLVPTWLTAQLAPTREKPACALRHAALHLARGYALVLLYASCATAAFFHSLSESGCALGLVALPLLAHARVLGARPVWASRRAGALLCLAWLLQAALAARALGEQPRASGRLAMQVAYDAALWACYWFVLLCRRTSTDGGSASAPLAQVDR